MIIREATLEDFPGIDAFDVFARDRKEEIKRGEIIVALIEDKVAGYLTHNRSFYDRPFVQFVCVNKEFRQRGVARRLYEQAEKIYKDENAELIFSSTEDDNAIMLGFFERHGWQKSGVIHNIQPQAEILFVKKLNQNELTFEPVHYRV
ncbi:MAG: GNAT family N-acetyltransferase [Bacteroidetes bacterium]|nr:GNAT family N-acetyltransferase [Bacteroidota bacterium]